MFPPGDLPKPPKLPKEFVFGGVVEENGEPELVPEPNMVVVEGVVLAKTVLLEVGVAVGVPKVKVAGEDDDDDKFLGGTPNGEIDVDVPKGEDVVGKLNGFVLAAWEGGGTAKEKLVVGGGAVLGAGALKENPEDDTGDGVACGVKPPLLPSDLPDVEEVGALNPANFKGGAGIERVAGDAELSCDGCLGRSSKSFRIFNRIVLYDSSNSVTSLNGSSWVAFDTAARNETLRPRSEV